MPFKLIEVETRVFKIPPTPVLQGGIDQCNNFVLLPFRSPRIN